MYQKTIIITNPATSTEVLFAHNIDNLKGVLSYEGFALRNDNTIQLIPNVFAGWEISIFDISSTYFKYHINKSDFGYSYMYLTFKYIKNV